MGFLFTSFTSSFARHNTGTTTMPKDNSIQSVLIIGSGPIVIGQACEFDYSGTQAARSFTGRRRKSYS